VGLVREACKRCGRGGALAAWRNGRRWTRVSGAITRPGRKEHDKQPHEGNQCKLVEKKMRHHNNAPSHQCEIGPLYLAFGARQFSAAAGYTTAW
jgi:hypothetical protein